MASLPRYEIKHVSRYFYDIPVRHSVMSLCLMPRNDGGQRLLRFNVSIDPPASMNSETDSYGNTKHVLNIHRQHQYLEIVTRSTVETTPPPDLPYSLGPSAWEEIRSNCESLVHWDFTHDSPFVRPSPVLTDFVERAGIKPTADPLESVSLLSDNLYHSLQYVPGSTSAISPIDHALESGQGVCQDYAHIMLAIARSWGMPARYVSGYLYVAGKDGGQARTSASHAWVECLFPGLGWVGFDPTNHCLADQRHIRVAVGRDYQDVSPVRGVLQGGGGARMEVEVRMGLSDESEEA